MNIWQSKEQLLGEWSPEVGQSVGIGESVFDPQLARRIQTAPVGKATMDSVPLGPDAFGRQAVVIGDQCFRVQKLDDQAMRGLGMWEPVDCHPSRPQNGIQLKKLPLD